MYKCLSNINFINIQIQYHLIALKLLIVNQSTIENLYINKLEIYLRK